MKAQVITLVQRAALFVRSLPRRVVGAAKAHPILFIYPVVNGAFAMWYVYEGGGLSIILAGALVPMWTALAYISGWTKGEVRGHKIAARYLRLAVNALYDRGIDPEDVLAAQEDR